MYSSTALVREVERQMGRSNFHSISIGGRDPLANVSFLLAALGTTKPMVPVMLDTDGQRPSALGDIVGLFALVQVVVEFAGSDAAITHAMSTLSVAAKANCAHSLVICPKDDTTDSQMLRIVEQVHASSAQVQVVIHPTVTTGEGFTLDRRWSTLLEQASAMHADCRLAIRIPPPAGLR